jgi:hypothetical protein
MDHYLIGYEFCQLFFHDFFDNLRTDNRLLARRRAAHGLREALRQRIHQIICDHESALYIHTTMKYTLRLGILMFLAVVPLVEASGDGVGSVLGVEAGYGYLLSGKGLSPQSPNALLTGLYYGYLIVDRPNTSALLSLVLGYNWFPGGAGANGLHAIVYGVEYEHVFFRQNWIALAVDYGLLFNLVLEEGRQGYAFGDHTRLGVGPVFNLSANDQILVNIGYNFMDITYFETASRLDYASLALRYQRRL